MTHPGVLQENTRIGNYTIIDCVDINSHSVVYRARVGDTHEQVWLQEYIPLDLAVRQQGSAIVQARPGRSKIFEDGLTLFLQEARILSQIRDPYIARVREYTEAGGTAFIAMDQEQGTTLENQLDQYGELTDEALHKLFIPILKGLRVIHSHGLLHRDINPGNIFMRENGPPLLLGFGSTHRALPPGEVSLESRVTPGYSAIEQYHDESNLGPWTDLYAFGATLYRCISSRTPIIATERVTAIAEGRPDPLEPAVKTGQGKYEAGLLRTIDRLLQPVIKSRPQSASDVLAPYSEIPDPRQEELKDELQQFTDDVALSELKLHPPKLYADPKSRVTPKQAPSSSNPLFWVISIGLLFGVGIFTFWPQIRSSIEDSEQNITQTPAHIEGTKIPEDILDRPLPDEAPPELPESVEFTRRADDVRADQYRKITQQDHGIRALLQSARDKMERGDLIDPPAQNALASLRAILILDSDNIDAIQGIDHITDLLLQRAENQFVKGDLKASEKTLESMRRVGIEVKRGITLQQQLDALDKFKNAEEERTKDAKIAEQQHLKIQAAEKERARQEKLAEQEQLKQQIAEQQRLKLQAAEKERLRQEKLAEQERLEIIGDSDRVIELLKHAEQSIGQGELTRSSAEDALGYYKRVLDIDANNTKARAGLAKIVRYYVGMANKALAVNQFDAAENSLNLVTEIDPDNQAAELLSEQMDLRKEVLQKARLQAQREEELRLTEQRKALEQSTKIEVQELRKGVDAYYRGEYRKAYDILEPLAEKGSARAQFRLGVLYLRGRGVTQNIDAGAKWIRKAFPNIQVAATAGEAWAQADLGSLYQTGLLVVQNDREAVRWYRAAAEQGYAGAQTNLGAMYADGKGVSKNRAEAVRWLKLAAEQGDKVARDNLSALGVQNLN